MAAGAWVFVCGPSGAGKDSVIAAARGMVSTRKDIVFSSRMVTRPAQPGSDHEPVSEPDFFSLQQAGALAWHWQAHGFHYGIARRYAQDVQEGRRVVVNASRAHVSDLPVSPDIRVVHINAGALQLHERLVQRGRDSTSAVASRLARNSRFAGMRADCVIVNDAELAAAARRLADYLLA